MRWSEASSAPVGVFDSGLGGLTVVSRLCALLPDESFYFVADQAHVPYGGRDLNEVRAFACGISTALVTMGCKAIVMACNISSAVALKAVQEQYPAIPILGVIEPGARAAADRTDWQRIGILATEGTVKSGAYRRALHAISEQLEVTEVACPLFVPAVESGALDTPETHDAATRYLQPLRDAQVDTVILGCTHYPFLLPVLQTYGSEFNFIDPAVQTALELQARLRSMELLAGSKGEADIMMTTGQVDTFSVQLQRFLPNIRRPTRIVPSEWFRGNFRPRKTYPAIEIPRATISQSVSE